MTANTTVDTIISDVNRKNSSVYQNTDTSRLIRTHNRTTCSPQNAAVAEIQTAQIVVGPRYCVTVGLSLIYLPFGFMLQCCTVASVRLSSVCL